jgi:hypothetical protein
MDLPALCAVALLAAPALAQEAADAGVPAESEAQLEKELEGALKADQKTPPGGPAPAAATSSDAAPAAALLRGAQSLNPDMSVILDSDVGYQRRAPSFFSGDDPSLGAGPSTRALGLTVQEVELAFSAIVDPYFKGEVYLTIPNLSGIEVEEAFATTTSLPWNLQIKAGSFRSAFGRQNGQHLHVQDFTRRPLINSAFLGTDGLRGPGLQVSWLAPLPFYLTLYGEATSQRFDVPAAPAAGTPPDPVRSFGNDGVRRPTLLAEAKAFFPLGEEWSLYTGTSFASGSSPGITVLDDAGVALSRGAGRDTALIGADAYLKWKPANVSGGYRSLAFQAEAVFRHFTANADLSDEWDGGAYAQVVAQVARRWFLGVRGDVVGLPTSSVTARTLRGAVSITWQGSEFSRVRAYLEYERANAPPSGSLLPTLNPAGAFGAFLQLEYSIGAHGAHPF